MRGALRFVAVGMAALAAVAAVGAAWLDLSAPAQALPPGEPALHGRYERVDLPEGPRRIVDVAIAGPDGEPVQLALSLPADGGPSDERLPVVVVVGGFGDARGTLAHVRDAGPNAVLAYGWPGVHHLLGPAPAGERLLAAHRAAHRAPVQIAAAVAWAAAQPWADSSRVSLIGVSLGAVVLPAAERLLVDRGLADGPTVLAYGGADLTAMAEANLRRAPDLWRAPAAHAIGLALRRLEPARHLPHLRGPLLIVRGETDAFIPPASVEGMIALAPEPKQVLVLGGDHVHPARPELLAALDRVSRAWILSLGAAAPPE